MTLDEVAQRLEELSVETGNEELQGLANVLAKVADGSETRCATCSQTQVLKEALAQIAVVVERTGVAPPNRLNDITYRRLLAEAQWYPPANAASLKGLVDP